MRSHALSQRGQAGRLSAAGGRGPFHAAGAGLDNADAFGMPPAFATIAIMVNVLFMQSGSHPAPIFKSSLISAGLPAKPPAATNATLPGRCQVRAPAGGSA